MLTAGAALELYWVSNVMDQKINNKYDHFLYILPTNSSTNLQKSTNLSSIADRNEILEVVLG